MIADPLVPFGRACPLDGTVLTSFGARGPGSPPSNPPCLCCVASVRVLALKAQTRNEPCLLQLKVSALKTHDPFLILLAE